MNSEKKNHQIILRDHTYDGIEEFDQKLPNWWLFSLYIFIVAFVVYWVAYYNLPFGIKSDTEKIEAKIAVIDQKREAQLNEMIASMTNPGLFEMSTKTDILADGKVIYESKCIACHGPELTGVNGPMKLPGVSLVDAEWKYGSRPLEIMKTVTDGSPDITKGMIAWKTQLGAADIAKVTAFVLSYQPDGYDPEAITLPPEPVAPPEN